MQGRFTYPALPQTVNRADFAGQRAQRSCLNIFLSIATPMSLRVSLAFAHSIGDKNADKNHDQTKWNQCNGAERGRGSRLLRQFQRCTLRFRGRQPDVRPLLKQTGIAA